MALETMKDVTQIGMEPVKKASLDQDDPTCYQENILYDDINSLISFRIQNGPIKEVGKNGCQVADMIATVYHIIKELNKKFPCHENEMTEEYLLQALEWQQARTKRRTLQGTEGTSKELPDPIIQAREEILNEPKFPDAKQIELTSDVVRDEKGTYMLKFWAEWCRPCKALNPVMDEVVKETGFTVYTVNVDKNSELAQKYGIRGIPTMLFFKDGEIKSTLVGSQPKSEIIKTINSLN